jgi:hypothetical protein
VVVGGEAQVEADGVDQPAGRGQLGQGGRLGGADPERLLADDVAAGPQGGRGLFGVDVVGAGDVHGSQRVVADQGLDRVIGPVQAELVGHLPGPGRGAAGDPGDVDPEPPQGLGVGLGHPAGAGDPDAEPAELAHHAPRWPVTRTYTQARASTISP